jgi:hypothetical protein
VKGTSVAAAGIVLLLGQAVLLLDAPVQARTSGTLTKCGVERWKVKTLQDKPVLHSAKAGTIAQLITVPKPVPLPGTRAPFKYNQFKVTAAVTKVIPEDDGDVHLVISDGTHTMIAEAPTATCNTGATTYRRNQMKNARAAAKVCNKAQLTGVAFFDFFHHQTGVAPNEIELHPLLAFKCVV